MLVPMRNLLLSPPDEGAQEIVPPFQERQLARSDHRADFLEPVFQVGEPASQVLEEQGEPRIGHLVPAGFRRQRFLDDLNNVFARCDPRRDALPSPPVEGPIAAASAWPTSPSS